MPSIIPSTEVEPFNIPCYTLTYMSFFYLHYIIHIKHDAHVFIYYIKSKNDYCQFGY